MYIIKSNYLPEYLWAVVSPKVVVICRKCIDVRFLAADVANGMKANLIYAQFLCCPFLLYNVVDFFALAH